MKALTEHRERQERERADAGEAWKDYGLVFTTRVGTPVEPDNLRHSAVSLLLDLGVPPHIVRQIVGHSDIGVTMKVYAHASLDEQRKALRRLGDQLG
ncbi:tyrosine-type recombinase/integrase [Streptomyces synnematoformans]|uniref:Tyr recombinase domain-containing protein n=1 Tax=Streptomyces synnematoformans TaxID=415721 RepID=A0ABN2XQU2_9ACTN